MSHTAIPTAATYTITGRVLQPTLGAPMADASAVQLDPNTGKLPPGIVPMSPTTAERFRAVEGRVRGMEAAMQAGAGVSAPDAWTPDAPSAGVADPGDLTLWFENALL